MSPQTHAIISNVFGTLGAVLWSIQLLPQIYLNARRRSADGLSTRFMLLWACAGVPLGTYNIAQNLNVALRVQAQILISLSLVTATQCWRYQRGWSWWRCVAVGTAVGALLGGLQVGLVFAVRYALGRGMEWPVKFMAVLAAVLLVSGVLEQYVTIWKTGSVEGISFIFCAVDAAGDVASIVSVAFEPQLDALGLAIYCSELAFWMGLFALGVYFKYVRRASVQDQGVHMHMDAVAEVPSRVLTSDGSQRSARSSTSVFQTGFEQEGSTYRREGRPGLQIPVTA